MDVKQAMLESVLCLLGMFTQTGGSESWEETENVSFPLKLKNIKNQKNCKSWRVE